jgi:adenylate cyclase
MIRPAAGLSARGPPGRATPAANRTSPPASAASGRSRSFRRISNRLAPALPAPVGCRRKGAGGLSQVFISYARSTEREARAIGDALRGLGYGVWRDDELPAHRAYADVIAERLAAAKAVVVIWSAEAAKSAWVRSEAEKARADNKLVQLRVDSADLPMPFDQIQCAELLGWSGDANHLGWKKVVESVGALCGRSAATSTAAAHTHSICVLPFANISDDPQQEYFSDGISEDIITDLSKVSALFVVARNTAFQFKGKSLDVPQVARQLNVSHVLEGSVRKAGNRVRITAQLIDGATGGHTWAERWDRDLDDIFALQDEISQAIVAALKLKLLPAEKKAIEKRGTTSSEAYDLYLMAREHHRIGNVGEARLEEAIVGLCRRAVEIDPRYAQAWAMMAYAQSTLAYNRGRGGDAGLAAAERAAELDPTNGLPHAVKALNLYWSEKNRTAALDELGRALALEPDSYEISRIAGAIYGQERDFARARQWYGRAAELAENDYSTSGMLISLCKATGDTDGMRAAAKMTLERAEKVLVTDKTNGHAMSFGVSALATLGEADRVRQWISRALLIDPNNPLMRYNFACTMSLVFGDLEGALELLGPVLAKDSGYYTNISQSDPDLDPLRGDPRFQAMMADAEARLARSQSE